MEQMTKSFQLKGSSTKQGQRKMKKTSVFDLADETLADILGMLVDCDRKMFDNDDSDIHCLSSTHRALQLSSVCRAFRFTLLDMRGAWAVVTSDNPGRAFLNMCIERSLDKTLRVYFKHYSDDSCLKLLKNLVDIHAIGRIRIDYMSVKLEVAPVETFGHWASRRTTSVPRQEEVVQLLGKLDYSSLNALHIRYLDKFTFDDGEEEEEDNFENEVDSDLDESENEHDNQLSLSARRASYELHSLLYSAELRSARFENTIPRPGLLFLTKLSLKLRCDESDKWDVQSLLDLLRSQPKLGELSLEFYEASTFSFPNATSAKVELPSINSLSLHWHATTRYSTRYFRSDIPRLFGILVLESVKEFRFKISPNYKEAYDSYQDYEMPLLLNEQLDFFLRHGGRFPLLESFHLELYSTVRDCVRLPSWYIKNVKHLSLHFNIPFTLVEYEDSPDDPPETLPRLQTLTLRNCDSFTRATVQMIIDAVKAGGNWAKFQQLWVDECRYLSLGSLEGIVEPGKLEVFANTRIFCYI